MDDSVFQQTLNSASNFELRRAIERLREGLFDPFGVQLLTAGEKRLKAAFNNGINQNKDICPHLCICGAYGHGKSHSLIYLQHMALDNGFVCSQINLDPREIPFHNFNLVYRELMGSLRFPNGENSFIRIWEKWVKNQLTPLLNNDSAQKEKTCLDLIPDHVLNKIPHRFKAVLAAIVQPTIWLHKDKRKLKKHLKFRPREFPYLLKRAMMGENIPSYRLTPVFRYRNVSFYRQGSLSCKGDKPYLDMIQALSAIFVQMGFKGWVLLFDEGESIIQGNINIRAKSYNLFDRLLNNHTSLYPVFAFTDDFFIQVEQEEYDKVRIRDDEEIPYFEKDYNTAWRNLNIHRLHDISTKEWKNLIKKLIILHSRAYRWQPNTEKLILNMESILLKKQGQEPRLIIKSLINFLDIENQNLEFSIMPVS